MTTRQPFEPTRESFLTNLRDYCVGIGMFSSTALIVVNYISTAIYHLRFIHRQFIQLQYIGLFHVIYLRVI
jgi:hypothetical protein